MFVISPTDNAWFTFLKDSGQNSFVNFWTPTPWNIKKLNRGNRWYFLLKSPIRQIGGFGEFYEYKNLTAIGAWNEFGQRNGCHSREDLINKIQRYLDKNSVKYGGKSIKIDTYQIGCVVLKNCQFWEEENYMNPSDYQINFPTQVVKLKYFEGYNPLMSLIDTSLNFNLISEQREDYTVTVKQRKGQGQFKGKILKAYNNKCCITGETCPELLEAAHIQPYLTELSNHIQNGILLRVDLHRLYDNGLLFIDKDYIVHISSLIIGDDYLKYNGKSMSLPISLENYPSQKALELKRADFRE